MKEKLKNFWPKMTLTGLCAVVILFAYPSSSVLAQVDKLSYEEYKKIRIISSHVES
jgi:hypothetical protein